MVEKTFPRKSKKNIIDFGDNVKTKVSSLLQMAKPPKLELEELGHILLKSTCY
jgi:hypothetical protein